MAAQKKDKGVLPVAKAKGIRDAARESSIVVNKPMNALAVTYDDAMALAKEHIGAGLQALTAAAAMRDLSKPQLADVFTYAGAMEDALGEARKLVRGRVLDKGLREGTVVTDKGSRRLDLGDGRYVPITVQKSGTDSKALEAGLVAKGIDRSKYMAATLVYSLKPNNETQTALIVDKVYTADELKTFDIEPTYRVDKVKEGKVDE